MTIRITMNKAPSFFSFASIQALLPAPKEVKAMESPCEEIIPAGMGAGFHEEMAR